MKTFTARMIFLGKIVQEQEIEAESIKKAQEECADSMNVLETGSWVEIEEKTA